MVVDYFQHSCLLNSLDRLGELIVIHQDQLFVIVVEDMGSHRISHQVIVVIYDRKRPELCACHLPACILRQLMSVELHGLERHHHPHGRGKIQIPGGIHRAVSGCYDRAVVLLREFKYTVIHGSLPDDDKHTGPFFDQDLLGLLIAARDHDPVCHLVILEILFVRHSEDTHLAV